MASTNQFTPITESSEWETLVDAVNRNAVLSEENGTDIDGIQAQVDTINSDFLTEAEGNSLALVIALS